MEFLGFPVEGTMARRQQLARSAAHQTDLITVHAFERHEFGSEVVPVHGLLAAVAHGARQQPEAAAHLACGAGVHTLKKKFD